MFVFGHLQMGWWNPQRDVTMPIVQSLSSTQKRRICHAILNEGKRLFQSTTKREREREIYIYIYMKANKGAAEIKFCYPSVCMWRKAVKHVRKAPWKYLTPLFGQHFCSFEDSLLGYSRSLFQKESPGDQYQFSCFWKPMSKDYGLIKSFKG